MHTFACSYQWRLKCFSNEKNTKLPQTLCNLGTPRSWNSWTPVLVPKNGSKSGPRGQEMDPENGAENGSQKLKKNVNIFKKKYLNFCNSWRKSQPRTLLAQQQQTQSIRRQPTQTMLKCASHTKQLPWGTQPAKRNYDNVSPARCCAVTQLAEVIGPAEPELGPRTGSSQL